MAGKKPKKKKGKIRRLFRWMVIGGGIAYVVHVVSERRKSDPCVPVGGPDERFMIKDEDNLSGLGIVMESSIVGLLEDPAKIKLLNSMSLSVAIKPLEEPEEAITMTFSGGYVVLEPGVALSTDILILCDLETLMQISGMGSGLNALKFMLSPEGMELVKKVFSGELKIEGIGANPMGMLKFARFLSQE